MRSIQPTSLPALLRVLVAAVALATPMALQAANLGAIYELARQNDAQFAAARAAADAGREKAVQGRAQLLPSVNLSGNLRQNQEQSSSYSGDRNYRSGALTLAAVQPLLRPANVEAARQGELQAQLAEEQLRLAEQELLLRVARGYFAVLQAEDVLTTVRAQKEAFAVQLAQVRRGLEVGTVPITDVNEAQSRTDLTAAQEIASLNELEVKRRTLERAVAQPLPALARLDALASLDLLSAEQQRALAERAGTDALAVRAATTAREIARRESRRQAAAAWPTVDLVASAGENRNTNYGVVGAATTRQVAIGVELAVPLYQGGAIDSRSREAAANLVRAEQELEAARRGAVFDAREAWLGVQSGSALIVALQQAQRSGESQALSTRRGLEVGVRNRVDVLNAEQQLYATRRDLAAARYQTLLAGLQLKAAAGQLAEADLRALDALLKE